MEVSIIKKDELTCEPSTPEGSVSDKDEFVVGGCRVNSLVFVNKSYNSKYRSIDQSKADGMRLLTQTRKDLFKLRGLVISSNERV